MKKLLITFCIITITFTALADEGIWLPILQKYTVEDMQKKGFKLTAQDIYDINSSSLKDAIIQFNGGCTGVVVSKNGLLFTNHHCGYDQIQYHSSVEHNYLDKGFWAQSNSEELPNPNLNVKFLYRMEDVTSQILQDIDDSTIEKVRDSLVNARSIKIAKEAEDNGKFEAIVKPIYYGNQYILYIYEVFNDVRLVGTPPDAIGKFGGDTDNWMWPRHTGDFSVFRIYANNENKPAQYSNDNIPYIPKRYIKISLKGYNEDDFTFIYGFPGRTQEYLSSYAVDMLLKHNPHKIKLRTQRLNIINADMANDIEIRIKYASKQASIANAWKKWQGEYLGLQRLDAVNKKTEFENRFTEWIKHDKARAVYKNLLADFKEIYNELNTYSLLNDYFNEAVMAPEIIRFAEKLNSVFKEKTDEGKQKRIKTLQETAADFFKNYNLETDRKIFAEVMQTYFTNIDKKYHAAALVNLCAEYNNDFTKISNRIYTATKLANHAWVNEFLSDIDGKTEEFNNDIALVFYKSFADFYKENISPRLQDLNKTLALKQRLFMRGQMEMQTDKNLYPDANSTLRIAYGKVGGFSPVDGTVYKHYTTLDGVIEKSRKEDVADYKIPAQLAELNSTKDFGEYKNTKGELPVAFLASNHTTGGNSGSPVLNAYGQLIGLNFDRCWESTMSDIMFDPNYCRNISIDIRYALFIIDKLAGAKRLINELELVK
ncbi:MAG: S46 family peptidase [Prevotellaceae bacterium]|nr:S46 family peptidase [Prevotellaceae bacterium]